MSTTIPEEIKIWAFPDFEIEVSDNGANSYFMQSSVTVEVPEEDKEAEKKEQNTSAMDAIAALTADLENLKKEYEKKLNIVNNLVQKFETPLLNMDQETVELIQYIIKKAAKNIIYKELTADTKLIKKIVKEIHELINARNGMVTAFLSEVDYNRLNETEESQSLIYKIDPSLTEGDVVLKSNHSEIRAILNDRINQILGIKYA
jgi:flagellar biosynthesis/type III secretory pathway protein FliH